MKLEILHVPDCPNTTALRDRIRALLAAGADVTITQRVIRTQAEAATHGMTGSPTLLVDGVDPFATPGQPSSVSCRLYTGENGTPCGAPSLRQLRAALPAQPAAAA